MSGHRRVRPAGKGRQCHTLDSAPTHFFRIMLPTIIQEKKLRIPKRFITRFGDELSHVATLNVPNGIAWNVMLERVDKEVYFKNGWHEFAQHHSIKEFYFLVFKYRGNSRFDVVVFDLSTTEVCYDKKPFHGKQYPSHHEEEMDDTDDDKDSIDILGSSHPQSFEAKVLQKRKPTLGGSSNPPANKKFGTTTRGQSAASLKNQEFKSECLARAKRLKMNHVNAPSAHNVKTEMGPDQFKKKIPKSEPKIEDEQLPGDGKEGDSHGTKTISRPSSMKKHKTTHKREEAIKAASMYKPQNPSFMSIMRPYNVIRRSLLNLPADFSKTITMPFTEFIKLRVSDGREWCVRYICSDDKRRKISKGWPAFVLANDLKEGDVCVFELIQDAEIVLKVTFFRANEDGGS